MRPITMALRPTIDPTERSMPDVKMTTVIPSEIMPISATKRVTSKKL